MLCASHRHRRRTERVLRLDDVHTAPLLCAGLIGWRALRMTGNARRLGFYGFGAAAHILVQVARWHGRAVLAFTRPGAAAAQGLGRCVAGLTGEVY